MNPQPQPMSPEDVTMSTDTPQPTTEAFCLGCGHFRHLPEPCKAADALYYPDGCGCRVGDNEAPSDLPFAEGGSQPNPLSSFGDDENDRMSWQQEEAGQDSVSLVAQKALVKAIWHAIVEASSMSVVLSGSAVNEAIRGFRAAIEAEARATLTAQLAEIVAEEPREGTPDGLPDDTCLTLESPVPCTRCRVARLLNVP